MLMRRADEGCEGVDPDERFADYNRPARPSRVQQVGRQEAYGLLVR
jgi:hypothetical protein